MLGEEPIGTVVEVEAILWLRQAVTLVLVHHVFVVDPTLFHGRDDLF
jgi:hypothetical protein